MVRREPHGLHLERRASRRSSRNHCGARSTCAALRRTGLIPLAAAPSVRRPSSTLRWARGAPDRTRRGVPLHGDAHAPHAHAQDLGRRSVERPGRLHVRAVQGRPAAAPAPLAAVPAPQSSTSRARLHHPVWIEDPNFDLSLHVRRVGCPAPGGDARVLRAGVATSRRASCTATGRCGRSGSIEGLEGDRVAFVAKIHHAVADGVAAASLLANVALDLSGGEVRSGLASGTDPGKGELFRDAVRRSRARARRLPEAASHDPAEHGCGPAAPTQGATSRRRSPSTRRTRASTAALTPHRIFTISSLSLDDVKTVKNAFGTTAERRRARDRRRRTACATCTSATSCRTSRSSRAYPSRRPLSPTGSAATRCRTCSPRLRTDIEDPVERLRAIHDVTKAAKEFHNVLGSEMLRDWSEITPPRPFAWFMRLVLTSRLGGQAPAADQPRRVERPGSAVATVDRGRRHRRAVLDGARSSRGSA